jgi:putative sterol carrier protein
VEVGFTRWERIRAARFSRMIRRNLGPRMETTTMAELFGDEWAQVFREEIAASEGYASAAKNWEGAMVLSLWTGEAVGALTERGVYLEIWHGVCRVVRAASREDLDGASYVVTAAAAVWREILEGRLEPLLGVMSGKLKLARGSFARLLPYVNAARELLAAAQRVPTEFPEGWTAG